MTRMTPEEGYLRRVAYYPSYYYYCCVISEVATTNRVMPVRIFERKT